MPKLVLVCVISALVASGLVMGQAFAADSPNVSKAVAAAVADSSRPATDSERDTDRKPAETLAFAGVKPGDRVADSAAGAGYSPRLFADVVGPQGHVYSVVPSSLFVYPNIIKGIAE